jgi:hypothetical protein
MSQQVELQRRKQKGGPRLEAGFARAGLAAGVDLPWLSRVLHPRHAARRMSLVRPLSSVAGPRRRSDSAARRYAAGLRRRADTVD